MGTSLSAEPLLSLAVTVTSEQRVEPVLQSIVEGLAAQPGVALARIWLLPSAGLPSCCRAVSGSLDDLSLVASAGTPINSPGEDWSFLQGHFARVPFNVGKVGQVAASRHPILVEDVAAQNDWIVRPEWAKREEIRSFAGHPLIFRDKLLGVIAVFSRQPLGQREFTWLGLFANQAALAIANACTEEALRSSERNLTAIINTIPTAAWTTRPDGYCDFLNQVWLDHAGMTAEQAQGWGWTAALHPDDRIGLLEYWRSVLASGKRGEIEGRLRRNDGAYRWFLFRAEPFCDENGKVVRWYGTNTDIEDLKQAEYLLAAEKHALEMIADGASLSDILNHVCTSMDLLVAPSMTTILLMDPDGKRLWHIAGPRVPREWVPIISPLPVALEAGLCGTAAFLKERIVVPDVATDPNWPDRLRPIAIRNGIRAGWSEPILTKNGKVVGTFALYAPESRVPTDADLALIEGAGRIALIAIERQRSQEALGHALNQVRESEHNLREIVESIPGFVCTLSAAGEVEVLNSQTLKYFGKTFEELKNWATSDAVHPDDLSRVVEAWRHSVETGEHYEMEFRQRRADGLYRWFQSRALPKRDSQGRIANWYMLLTDIHDRKRAEDALRESERSLRLLVDGIPGLVFTATADGEIEFVNQQILDYTGRTLEELKCWATSDLVHPDDLPQVLDELRYSLETGQSHSVEHRVRGADGIYRWFVVRRLPQRDIEGRIVRWFLLLSDIDERKRAEDALRTAERDLRMIFETIPGFAWTMSAAGEVEVVSQQMMEYFGKTLEDLKNWSSFLHPDDRARVVEYWKRTVETGQSYEVEHRLRRADGTYRWFQGRGRPLKNAEGRVICWYNLLTDIDEIGRAHV